MRNNMNNWPAINEKHADDPSIKLPLLIFRSFVKLLAFSHLKSVKHNGNG
jgi:hypothetical protein